MLISNHIPGTTSGTAGLDGGVEGNGDKSALCPDSAGDDGSDDAGAKSLQEGKRRRKQEKLRIRVVKNRTKVVKYREPLGVVRVW